MRVPLIFRDLDALGHVNNAVYFTYMETARIAHLRRLFKINRIEDMRVMVARVACDYRSPAEFGDVLEIGLAVERVGQTSWTYRYIIREVRTGRSVAEGETVHVAYDYRQRKPRPLPSSLRAQLKELRRRAFSARKTPDV